MISKWVAISKTVSTLERRNDNFPLINKEIMKSIKVKCIQHGTTTHSKISQQ